MTDATSPAMIDMLEALRRALAPHYRVDREIGAGGMARVFLAEEQHPRRSVAIKVMDPELSNRISRERFVREVELSSRLNHPHVVPILTANECLFLPEGPDGLCYYVMPYIEGESLRYRLQREQRLPLEDALHMFHDVADALAYAHAQGVIHRDVKPENILISGGHAMVADFGIARAISAAGGDTLTAVGQPIGSPAYMSPEQLAGSRAIDERTDVYSLGCVLYEMLVGEPPLLDLVGQSSKNRHSLESALRLGKVSSGRARVVKEAIARALSPLPQDRFGSVAEFAAFVGATGRDSGERLAVGRWPLGRWKSALLGAAGALVLVTLVMHPNRGGALNPNRIVVALPENHTGDPTLDALGHLAADWVTQGLAQSGLVEVVHPPSESDEGRHLDQMAVRALARETRAGTVVAGAYYLQRDSVWFQVEFVDGADGRVLTASDAMGAPRTTPFAAADAVRRRVTAALDTLLARQPRR
ncbi:MAG: serine/threonine-protein kinase [Candidatus Eiseniibacteriota bacterium]